MKTIQNISTEVYVCDFCKRVCPSGNLETCSLCGKEGCMKDAGTAHWAFLIDVYNYKNTNRSHFRICVNCKSKFKHILKLLEGR